MCLFFLPSFVLKEFFFSCLSEKYEGLKQIVSKRAIFSVGFSIFSAVEPCSAKESGELLKGQIADSVDNQSPPWKFHVRTYDFLLLPSDDFVISPSSATFLVRHGFDFTRMFLDGIYYTRPSGNRDYQLLKIYKTALLEKKQTKQTTRERRKTKKRRRREKAELFADLSTTEAKEPKRKSSLLSILPLGLLAHLGEMDIPIIFHNGLLDLAFLYSSFEDNLPDSSEEFIKNLHQLLPCIYDTKLLSYDQDSENETSLDTVYQLCVSWNQMRESQDETFIQCCTPANIPSPRETAPTPTFKGNKQNLNSYYSSKTNLRTCNEHSSVKNDREACSVDSTEEVENCVNWNSGDNSFVHYDHSAGYDAFCTAYIFATYLHSKGLSYVTRQRNSIYLSRAKPLSLQ